MNVYFTLLLLLRHSIEIFCLLTIGGFTTYKLLPSKKVLPVSIAHSIVILLIRMLPIKFGIHTLISLTLMIIYYHTIFGLSINQAAIATFSTTVLLVILEWGNSYFYLNKLHGLSLAEMGKLSNPEMLKLSLPPLIILILLAIVGRSLVLKKLKNHRPKSRVQ